MSTNFETAFQHVVAAEGGFANLKGDPGGRTMYGITERDHPDLWRPGPPTLQQAKDRYRRDYWDACRCGELPWPLAHLVFDAAVNQGCFPSRPMPMTVRQTPFTETLSPSTRSSYRQEMRSSSPALVRAIRSTVPTSSTSPVNINRGRR